MKDGTNIKVESTFNTCKIKFCGEEMNMKGAFSTFLHFSIFASDRKDWLFRKSWKDHDFQYNKNHILISIDFVIQGIF